MVRGAFSTRVINQTNTLARPLTTASIEGEDCGSTKVWAVPPSWEASRGLEFGGAKSWVHAFCRRERSGLRGLRFLVLLTLRITSFAVRKIPHLVIGGLTTTNNMLLVVVVVVVVVVIAVVLVLVFVVVVLVLVFVVVVVDCWCWSWWWWCCW